MYLTQGLHRGLQQYPDRIATVSGDRRQSFAQLHDRVGRWAAVLRGLGVGVGDRVALLAPNIDAYIEFAYGCWWAGAVIVPINTRWSAAEIAFALTDSGASVLITDGSLAGLARTAAARVPELGGLFLLREDPVIGMPSVEALLQATPPVADPRIGGDTLAAIFYTGGTTGRPKGVMLSHTNLWSAMISRLADSPLPHAHVVLLTAPLFHIAGFGRVLVLVILGGTGVFLPAFDAAALITTVEREQVTDLMLVPTMLDAVLSHPDFHPDRLRSVARISYGAAPISEALLDRALALLPGIGFTQAYGMTENWGVATFNPPENHVEPTPGAGRPKLRVTGRAYGCAEIAIADPEGRPVTIGEVGRASNSCDSG